MFVLGARVNDDVWLGFHVYVPLGRNIEDTGFGQNHAYNMENSTIESSNWRVLTVKFPDDAHMTIQSIPEAQLPRFSEKVLGRQGLLTVKYKPGTRATIYGFGLPFSNPGHPADGWFNRDEPMVASLTLREFLEQSVFTMVVGRVPGPAHLEKVIKEATLSPFTYPYGRDHMWDVTRYVTPDGPASGTKFALRQSFDDDNSHVAVLTQSVAQDQIWVAHEAAKLFATKVHAYLVPEHEGSAEPASYFAIVAFTDELRAKFELLWKAISKPDARLSLAFHKDMAPIDPPSIEGISEWKKLTQAQWMAKMRNHPASIPVLKDHPVKEGELVFQVRVDRRPGNAVDVKMWPSREVADSRLSQDEHSWHVVSIFFDADLSDARRKVEAACLLLPDASPVNPKACNGDIGFCMELQRDLFRGNGFHRALSAADATWEQDLVNAMASTHVNEDTAIKDAAARIRRIPIVDLFKVPRDYLVALKENILPEDCSRFTEYFSTRPLGLGIITAPPGFGKTTAVSVATLGMAKTFGKVYVSAPTHVAVTNFALRLRDIDEKVIACPNEGKNDRDPTRARRQIVIRGYKLDDEILAFRQLLERYDMGEKAAPAGFWRGDSKWQLELSLAYWVLLVLHSPAVREPHVDDSPKLDAIKDEIKPDRLWMQLRLCVAGKLQWNEIKAGEALSSDVLGRLFSLVVEHADVVCTTPAASERLPYRKWKRDEARAVAVDEAANMSRPDLLSVWGNTLAPCLLAGDDQQLSPAVMTQVEGPGEGKFFQRHAEDAGLSPLALFKMSGILVYRLKTQFRMAQGLFDLCHKTVYPDLPFQYGPGCDISLPHHDVGRKIEDYLREKHPSLAASPAGSLAPVFFHCPGTFVRIDEATGAKICRAQSSVALDLAVSLVKDIGADPAKISIVSCYKANVEVMETLRRRSGMYAAFEPMSACATVGSFQGRENDIMIVVMGTNTFVGTGFTKDKHRLNVMFSRQRCALLVVGDIQVGGRFLGPGVVAQTKAEKAIELKEKAGSLISLASGEVRTSRAIVLRRMYETFVASGRIVEVRSGKEAKGDAKTKEDAEEAKLGDEQTKELEKAEKKVEAENKAKKDADKGKGKAKEAPNSKPKQAEKAKETKEDK